eukprot:TRINITY_DN1438_c0_g1_i3.p1 TRINITY_DN1438_c0_g1~~TRINITY_DN1438_c0_g1_i3.p1  ORF type:complete len:296 (-),score=71.32 TRINITY_DN1438_c0_g1_i3:246-1133(-)
MNDRVTYESQHNYHLARYHDEDYVAIASQHSVQYDNYSPAFLDCPALSVPGHVSSCGPTQTSQTSSHSYSNVPSNYYQLPYSEDSPRNYDYQYVQEVPNSPEVMTFVKQEPMVKPRVTSVTVPYYFSELEFNNPVPHRSPPSYSQSGEDNSDDYEPSHYGNIEVPADGVDPPVDFKIPASRSPILESLVVCAVKKWGIEVVKATQAEVVFKVTDFDKYYRTSRSICSKQHPTEDVGSRVKSLRRWFVRFPKKKERLQNGSFNLVVKPQGAKKVSEMIQHHSSILNGGIQKRRRRQ